MYCSQWFTFEIPDAWWDAAGMRGFKTDRKAYRRSPQSGAEAIIMLVDGIGVDPRGPGVPTLEQYRMISVLRAIRLDRAMSPIEVTKASGQGHSGLAETFLPQKTGGLEQAGHEMIRFALQKLIEVADRAVQVALMQTINPVQEKRERLLRGRLIGEHALHGWRVDGSRADAVHPDALAGVIGGQTASQVDDGGLAGAVHDRGRVAT